MDKTLNKDISKMQNGIGGFYRTKGFKIRVAICILLTVAILASIFAGVFISTRWNGRVIFLCRVSGAYNYFYNANPSFLSSLDMTKKDFESKASVKVIYGSSSVWSKELISLGVFGVDYERALDINVKECYILLLNKKGEIVYQGKSASELLNELDKMHF